MAGINLFADSFSRYKVATCSDPDLFGNMVSRYTSVNNGPGVQIISTGRNGQGLTLFAGNGISKTLPHSGRWVTGFAFRYNTTPGNSFIYSAANNNAPLVNIDLNLDGTLSIRAGNSNTIAVSARTLFQDRWYYVELDAEFSGTTPITCTAELRVNGHVEASGSGSTSVNASSLLSGDATANYHTLAGTPGPGGNCSFDDLYIKGSAGYYGDIRIIALFPDGDGATLQWTPNSGVVHFDRVNTHPVDYTKYLYEVLAGNIDTWDWEDCPGFSGTIKAINLSALARKDDEGTKSFKIVVGNTGSEAESDEFFVSDVTPEYYEYSLDEDPATSLPWTQAGFNAKQFGVKLIS